MYQSQFQMYKVLIHVNLCIENMNKILYKCGISVHDCARCDD